MKKICFIVSSAMTINAFLLQHIKKACLSYDVTIIGNFQQTDILECEIPALSVCIERKISFCKDIKALFTLCHIYRKHRYWLVHSVTPKAGLIAMVAAFISRVPVRIHTFTGQVWVTKKGMWRKLLMFMDKTIASCATHVLVDSHSQRDFLVSNRIVSEQKSRVLGHGSICGIDRNRFQPNKRIRQELRDGLGILPEEVLFLFIGRLTKDKGVLDLARSFAHASLQDKTMHLLFVGSDEDHMHESIMEACSSCRAKVHFSGHAVRPEDFMAAADVLVLPSYREGFGMVIIEAAAVGIPAIASRIYGITDAVVDGETGLLFPPGEHDSLARHLLFLSGHHEDRQAMGSKAQQRAYAFYSADDVSDNLLRFYRSIVNNRDHA